MKSRAFALRPLARRSVRLRREGENMGNCISLCRDVECQDEQDGYVHVCRMNLADVQQMWYANNLASNVRERATTRVPKAGHFMGMLTRGVTAQDLRAAMEESRKDTEKEAADHGLSPEIPLTEFDATLLKWIKEYPDEIFFLDEDD